MYWYYKRSLGGANCSQNSSIDLDYPVCLPLVYRLDSTGHSTVELKNSDAWVSISVLIGQDPACLLGLFNFPLIIRLQGGESANQEDNVISCILVTQNDLLP